MVMIEDANAADVCQAIDLVAEVFGPALMDPAASESAWRQLRSLIELRALDILEEDRALVS